MIRRLLVAAVSILLLPFLFSASPLGTTNGFAGGSSVAFAGHTNAGDRWCACGTADCTCDPGELRTQPALNQTRLTKHGATTGSRGKAESSDFGQLGLLFALALLFWRLRY